MNTPLTHPRFGFALPRVAPSMPRYSAPAVLPAGADTLTWLERLAAWAERQPMHRRLGSYTRLR